jgi:thiol-disulfide isomerase/thioredoxin
MRFYVACLLALVCTGCHTGLRSWLLGQKPPYLNKPDPDFALSSVSGASKTLAAYKGRVVVMNMWATWCPPCRQEIPALERYARGHERRGIVVVGVDQGEPTAPVVSFVREQRIGYPVLLDPAQRYWHYYDVTAIPTTIVLDRRGVAVKAYFGEFDPAAIDRTIASVRS